MLPRFILYEVNFPTMSCCVVLCAWAIDGPATQRSSHSKTSLHHFTAFTAYCWTYYCLLPLCFGDGACSLFPSEAAAVVTMQHDYGGDRDIRSDRSILKEHAKLNMVSDIGITINLCNARSAMEEGEPPRDVDMTLTSPL